MTENTSHMILAKHLDSGVITLYQHLQGVAEAAALFAAHWNMDVRTARMGAYLHDIGKTSNVFQRTLRPGYVRKPGFVWRHEIASLFFLSVVPEEQRPHVVDMIVAHHKSAYKDAGDKGLLDLDDYEEDCFSLHAQDFEKWCPDALSILASLGMEVHDITREEAYANYRYAVDYCWQKRSGCSMWKGLLMAADHLVSACEPDYASVCSHLFIRPDLAFYQRRSELYPLSMLPSENRCRHTLVTAPTGAGKTDFLLRRCKSRVFYTLPFQASINAMYDRIKNDLKDTDAEVTLLHATSDLKISGNRIEERIMQHHVGSSVKVMTPHQMASIVFGIKGYESMSADLHGCDVILDEIHTYTSTMQAVVCKIIEILVELGCRIHVGTATMPSTLYNRILALLGGPEYVYQVKLPDSVLGTFNRHIIHKCPSDENIWQLISESISDNRKVLVVCNQVKRAQQFYQDLCEQFESVDKMLIHSRFKRGDRVRLEKELTAKYNRSSNACVVVSTQVVEVSLDISFDVMITECAPIDAMIQRFGRINRKRTASTIGCYKPIYVLAPFEDDKDCLPYASDVLQRSYDVLPDGEVLKESDLQNLIDKVYPDDSMMNLNYSGVVFVDGRWQLRELCHRSKSALLDVMNYNSAVCVLESDEEAYKTSGRRDSLQLEIPVSYHSIAHRNLKQIEQKGRPFVVPDAVYHEALGLQLDILNTMNKETFEIL